MRAVRGRRDDPAWVRPALLALLTATAVAYLWALGDSGWANTFYSAAVQAGTKSWKAFLFGSSDSSNFITVDKPPASLWVMELSARIFGLSSWSILVPQALEGVATVAMIYATVRRWFSPGAALLAGAVTASTPVAALMFRYNNPDALLVLLLTVAAYATVRALERAGTWWLVLAAVAIGTGFVTKMLQAFLIVPTVGLVYLLAAPTHLARRIRQLLLAALTLAVSSGWWVAAVQLTPAADRPYIGGSQNNSLLNLIFGYNGFGRISGNESGSLGGSGPVGSRWGPTGLLRLFQTDMGGQVSWLIPGVLILLVSGLWWTRRASRTDRTRAALVFWGGWLIVTGLVFSYAQGIIHPYYNIALAPAIGALAGIGTVGAWRVRHRLSARLFLSSALCASAVWSFVLLSRSPNWFPWLRFTVLVLGLAATVLVASSTRLGRRASLVIGATALSVVLAGPVAYALDTVSTPHSGAIPSAGPSVSGAGVGVAPGGGPGGGIPPIARATGLGRGSGTRPAGTPTGGPNFAGGPGSGFAPPGGGFPGSGGGAAGRGGIRGISGGSGSNGSGSGQQALPPAGGGAGGAAGGFFGGTTPSKAVVQYLEKDAGKYKWMAATVNSNSAAGYQLGTGYPVMAIGGFNGTDPAPTLSQFELYVHRGEIHYFIAGGGGTGGGGPLGAGAGSGATETTASWITQWVESHYKATTVDGVTIYDLQAS